MMGIEAIPLGVKTTKPKRSSTTPESAVVHAVKQWAKDKPDVYIVRVVPVSYTHLTLPTTPYV